MPRPRAYVGKHTTKVECEWIYGVSERQKQYINIHQKYANMKFKYRNREFWCRGYYVDTVGKDKKAIQQYIANQLKEDKEMEQMTIFEMNDPFKK